MARPRFTISFLLFRISFFYQSLTFIFFNLKPKSPIFRTEIRFPVSSGNGKKYRNFGLSDRNGKPWAIHVDDARRRLLFPHLFNKLNKYGVSRFFMPWISRFECPCKRIVQSLFFLFFQTQKWFSISQEPRLQIGWELYYTHSYLFSWVKLILLTPLQTVTTTHQPSSNISVHNVLNY